MTETGTRTEHSFRLQRQRRAGRNWWRYICNDCPRGGLCSDKTEARKFAHLFHDMSGIASREVQS